MIHPILEAVPGGLAARAVRSGCCCRRRPAATLTRRQRPGTAGQTAINDVDPLAEEVDPASGEMIGNVPQAFSHIGLINAAWAIDQALQRARP